MKQYIRAGTKIISDEFASYVSVDKKHTLASYRPLRKMNYTHEWVNHSKNYVNPENGAHTNRIEGAWEIRITQYIKHMRGTPLDLIPEYLDEYLWRSWLLPDKPTPTDALRAIVEEIKACA